MSSHRDPQDCPFRVPLPTNDGTGMAWCQLLKIVSGVDDVELCGVKEDACRECCRSFPPSEHALNPVIASLLYQLSSRVITRGGVAGCSLTQANTLHRQSAANLPTDEDLAGDASAAASQSVQSIETLLPTPRRRCGTPVRKWAVGVTTAPRGLSTLSDCLDSLIAAGWDAPRLFIDGDVEIEERFSQLDMTLRDPAVGAWPNYYLSLVELMMRNPDADAYLLVQDDTLFYDDPGLQSYLERMLWPGRRPGIVSLFCSRAYTRPRAGWYRFHGAWVWCALAFIFSRSAAQKFVGNPNVVRHRWTRRNQGLANIDLVIGRFAKRNRIPLYYPTPSLVQHIGHVSSLWRENLRTFGNRRASWFAGDRGVRTC